MSIDDNEPSEIEQMLRVSDNILTPEKIHFEIRKYLEAGLSHIEALVEYSEQTGLEIETLGEIIRNSDILKSKVKDDANNLKLLKKLSEEDEVATLF